MNRIPALFRHIATTLSSLKALQTQIGVTQTADSFSDLVTKVSGDNGALQALCSELEIKDRRLDVWFVVCSVLAFFSAPIALLCESLILQPDARLIAGLFPLFCVAVLGERAYFVRSKQNQVIRVLEAVQPLNSKDDSCEKLYLAAQHYPQVAIYLQGVTQHRTLRGFDAKLALEMVAALDAQSHFERQAQFCASLHAGGVTEPLTKRTDN